MTSDIIRAAIKQLRASVEALPEGFRGPWTLSRDRDYVQPDVTDDEDPRKYYVVANAALAAPHIALTASPHVTEALAQLFEALDKHERAGFSSDPAVYRRAYEELMTATRALAEAITHRRGT